MEEKHSSFIMIDQHHIQRDYIVRSVAKRRVIRSTDGRNEVAYESHVADRILSQVSPKNIQEEQKCRESLGPRKPY